MKNNSFFFFIFLLEPEFQLVCISTGKMHGETEGRSHTETCAKRLSTLVLRVWADGTPVVRSGRKGNTTEALEGPGVVERQSTRLTQIKHKEGVHLFIKSSLHEQYVEKSESK